MALGATGNLGTLYVNIRAKFNRLQSDMKKAETGLSGISGAAMNVGAALTKYVTLPIVAVGALGYASAAEIGKGYMLAARHLGYTGEKLEELKVRFRKVWRSVPEGSEVVAGVLIHIEQKFSLAGNAADKMTKRLLDFARVTGAEPVAAARNLGMWLQQNNIRGKEQVRVIDRLTLAHQKTGIPMDTLLNNLKMQSKMMQGLGYDYKDQISLLSKLEKGGYDLGNATDGLRMANVRMAKEGFKDGETAMKAFIERIKTAPTAVDATARAVEIFGSRSGPKMSEAIRAGVFDLEDWNDKLGNSRGQLNKTTEETYQLSDKIKLLGKKILGLFEIIGKVFIFAIEDIILPALTSWANKLDKVADSMDNSGRSSESLRALYAKLGTALIGLALVGPIVYVFGAIGAQFKKLGASAGWVASKVLVMGKTLGALAGVSTIAGIGLVIAIIVAVAAAIYLVIAHWDELKRAWNTGLGLGPFGQMLHAFKIIMAPAIEELKKSLNELKKSFKELMTLIGPSLIEAFKIAASVMGFTTVAAITGLSLALTVLIGLFRVIVSVVYNVGRVLYGLGLIIVGVMSGNMATVRKGSKELETGIINLGSGVAKAATDSAKALASIGKNSAESLIRMIGAGGALAESEGKKQGKKAGGAFNSSFADEAKKTKTQKIAEVATELKKVSRKDIKEAKSKLKLIAESWASIQNSIKDINVKSLNTAIKLVKLFRLISASIMRLKGVFDDLGKGKGGNVKTGWMKKILDFVKDFYDKIKELTDVIKPKDIDQKKIASLVGIAKSINRIVRTIGILYTQLYGNLLTPQEGGKPPMLETEWISDVGSTIRKFVRMVHSVQGVIENLEISNKGIGKIRRIAKTLIGIIEEMAKLKKMVISRLVTAGKDGGAAKVELSWLDRMRRAVNHMINRVREIQTKLNEAKIDPAAMIKARTIFRLLHTVVQEAVRIKALLAGKSGDVNMSLVTNLLKKIATINTTIIETTRASMEKVKTIFRTFGVWLTQVPSWQAASLRSGGVALHNALTPAYRFMINRIKHLLRVFGASWLILIPMWQMNTLRAQAPAFIPRALNPFYRQMVENIKTIIRNFSSNWLVNVPRWFHDTLMSTAGHWMGEAGKKMATKLIDAVKERLGIHSPSDAFRSIGRYMILGMIQGLEFDSVMQVMGHAFGGFMGFAFDLYNFMSQNMGKGWEWLTDYLGVDQVELLYQKLQELFSLMAGPGLMGWLFNYIQNEVPGNQILTSGTRPGSTVAGSGRTSLHASGKAMDIAGDNMDGTARLAGKIIGGDGWASGVLKTGFGEALYKTMTGGNHFDHVHLGVTGISPFLQSIMPAGGFGGGGGDVQAMLAAAANQRGWGGQVGSLMALIQRESGFNPAAKNPSSTAYGLFQMLTETSPDVGTQIRNGMNYIAGRYGDPNAAWNFWQGHNWYKGGGEVSATLHHGERVLTEQQNRWFTGLASPLGSLTSDAGAAKISNGKIKINFPSGTKFKITNLRQGIMEVVDEGIDGFVKDSAEIDDWVGKD